MEQIADWLVVLKDGHQLFDGPAAEMSRGPSHLIVSTRDADQLQVVARISARHGFASTLRDSSLDITAPVEFAEELNRRSMASGVVLVRIEPAHADLEHSFLNMIGGEQ